ncbi:hypothetical protein GUI12_00125 [Anaplasmataceae bacterium AB001_6]|nr:hypothetical protein GUI12_00125 [Anaplasmataceae bacterium AB001_6]
MSKDTLLQHLNYATRVLARMTIVALTLPKFLLISLPVSLVSYVIDSLTDRNQEQTLAQRLGTATLNTLNIQINTIETAEDLIDKYHNLNVEDSKMSTSKKEAMGILSSAFLTSFTVATTTFIGAMPLMIFTVGDLISRETLQKNQEKTSELDIEGEGSLPAISYNNNDDDNPETQIEEARAQTFLSELHAATTRLLR